MIYVYTLESKPPLKSLETDHKQNLRLISSSNKIVGRRRDNASYPLKYLNHIVHVSAAKLVLTMQGIRICAVRFSWADATADPALKGNSSRVVSQGQWSCVLGSPLTLLILMSLGTDGVRPSSQGNHNFLNFPIER